MCHHNTFLLYCSIDNTSLTKWNKVTHASILVSFITMVLMAFGGYATFTESVQGDLLNNYCWNDDLMNVSRLLFSITILLTFPIECFVCREVFFNFIGSHETQSWAKHVGLTVALVGLAYLCSLITNCLGVVLEINVRRILLLSTKQQPHLIQHKFQGLVGAVPLAFIIPAVCYLRLEEGPLMSRKKAPALILAVFGLAVTILGTIIVANKVNHTFLSAGPGRPTGMSS